MATRNRILELLERGEATLEDALGAIEIFEHELGPGQGLVTRACSSCGRPFVVSAPGPAADEEGRRTVCWRRACRQELRARGLTLSAHHLPRTPRPSGLPH